jgi:hypothetical protein
VSGDGTGLGFWEGLDFSVFFIISTALAPCRMSLNGGDGFRILGRVRLGRVTSIETHATRR